MSRSRVLNGWRAGSLLALLMVGCHQVSSPSQVSSPRLQGPAALQVPAASVTPMVSADPADPAWCEAPQIQQLTLSLHASPKDRPLPTRIALQWDKDWLYIRFTATGPEPYAPHGTTRDAMHYQGDAVEVFLDPVGDGRQYFEIQLSPANGVMDQNTLITTEPKSDAEGRLLPIVFQRDYWPNLGYDMKDLRTASRVTQQGDQFVWTADFAIPAKASLKRTGKERFEPMKLRVNLMRYHWTGPLERPERRLIPMNWAPVTFGCPHQSPAAMGTIELVGSTR